MRVQEKDGSAFLISTERPKAEETRRVVIGKAAGQGNSFAGVISSRRGKSQTRACPGVYVGGISGK